MNAEPPHWALDFLHAILRGDYGKGDVVLTGDEAEAVRNAYYQYWSSCGQPASRLHARVARSVYASKGIHLGLLRPALAALLGESSRSK
ncbi:hypothetical protein [Ralstonia chuxiongensis]|uniref:hypothetical protein n=1 Tax=Ralstonia chuxiongensis TaxID=2957504 RepID=UPI0028F564B4|nr:hypothetical protein [Ralstonia chuxiongensis]CAJ0784604.1 hypothetical protein R8510_05279 [Ralstonia chuxiongensis]